MDRTIAYIGESPQDTDILKTNLHPYVSLAKIVAALIGTSTHINGFACTATSPPSLAVNVGQGEIYALEQIDINPYGSLPPNSKQIMKQGINLGTTGPLSCPAPSTVGFSINYLVEITFSETDNGDQVLPWFNSANPSQAFSGPNNYSQPTFKIRQDFATIQVKAGTAATTGTQTTPSPDAGFVGAWVVTVAHGATTITSGNISQYANAPFIVIGGGALQIQYAADTGTTNALAIAPPTAITSYSTGQDFLVKVANTNTGNSTVAVSGLSAINIVLKDGVTNISPGDLITGMIAEMVYDGTSFQLLNPLSKKSIQNSVYTYAADTGTANTYAVAPTPAVGSYVTGLRLTVLIGNTNTGASTLNVSSLGTKNIKTQDGNNPLAGMLLAGMEADLFYNGTNFLLLNPYDFSSIQSSKFNYAADTGTANTYAVAPTPAIGAYVTGLRIIVLISNTNTGSSTIAVSGLAAKNIKTPDGNNPLAGTIISGMEADLFYNGTNFILLNGFGAVSQQNSTHTYAADTGSANAYAIAPSPAVSAYSTGNRFVFLVANTNTGASTLNVSSLGTKSIITPEGNAINSGMLLAGMEAEVFYNGTSFVLMNPDVGSILQNNSYIYYADTGAANAYVITPVPAITSYVAGQTFFVNISNPNSGASTINVNGLGAKSITTRSLGALVTGDLLTGQIIEIVYDGTQFQMVNYASSANASSWILISSQTASSSPNISFTNIGGYRRYKLIIEDFTSGGSGQSVLINLSTNNGSSYVATASYNYNNFGFKSTASTIIQSFSLGSGIGYFLNVATVDGTSGLVFSGDVNLYGMNTPSIMPGYTFRSNYGVGAGVNYTSIGGGTLSISGNYNALQISLGQGALNFSGVFTLYALT